MIDAVYISTLVISSLLGETGREEKRKPRHSTILSAMIGVDVAEDSAKEGSKYATASAATTRTSLVVSLVRKRASKALIPPEDRISLRNRMLFESGWRSA